MSPRLFLTVLVTLSLAPALHAQSLAEAAAAAAKTRAVKPVDTTKVLTNKDLPTVASTAPAAPAAAPTTVVSREASAVAVTAVPDAARHAAELLLNDRLQALAALGDQRDHSSTQYRDACAGKATSAGWLLRGQLIMTPNAQTPECRTIASDLAHQTAAFTLEHDAITETARTHGVLPGVLRDLFARAGLPE